jgi:hypothetical protein
MGLVRQSSPVCRTSGIAALVDGKPVRLLHDDNAVSEGFGLRQTFEAAGVRFSESGNHMCGTQKMSGE